MCNPTAVTSGEQSLRERVDQVIESSNKDVQHIFIIGSKSIGQYGGYETFVDKLSEQHKNNPNIKYHIACKANGSGFMDESKLEGVEITKKNSDGTVSEFTYNNAHVFKLPCPNLGPAVAIVYDRAAMRYSIEYCKQNNIKHPIFYILTCRIGPFIGGLRRKVKRLGGRYYLNPDGHEWMRVKWLLLLVQVEAERLLYLESVLSLNI